MHNVDPATVKLHFEGCRLRQKSQEYALLPSIMKQGILTPLIGVSMDDGSQILLDGFKRYRLAIVVGLKSLPFESLGSNELDGILSFIRLSVANSLNVLEQASFIKYLESEYKMTIGEIAWRLDKSKGWVSMRRHLIDELSDKIRERIFKDEFPGYAYMYTLRPFMRMNEASSESVESFVCAVSGKKLTTREIDRLAYGYFKGPQEFKEHIDNGQIDWALKRSQGLFKSPTPSCSGLEISTLKDLEYMDQGIQRLNTNLTDPRLKGMSFFAQAGLLVEKILEREPSFMQTLRKFHDRSRDAAGGIPAPSKWDHNKPNQSAASSCPQHGEGDP